MQQPAMAHNEAIAIPRKSALWRAAGTEIPHATAGNVQFFADFFPPGGVAGLERISR